MANFQSNEMSIQKVKGREREKRDQIVKGWRRRREVGRELGKRRGSEEEKGKEGKKRGRGKNRGRGEEEGKHKTIDLSTFLLPFPRQLIT